MTSDALALFPGAVAAAAGARKRACRGSQRLYNALKELLGYVPPMFGVRAISDSVKTFLSERSGTFVAPQTTLRTRSMFTLYGSCVLHPYFMPFFPPFFFSPPRGRWMQRELLPTNC